MAVLDYQVLYQAHETTLKKLMADGKNAAKGTQAHETAKVAEQVWIERVGWHQRIFTSQSNRWKLVGNA